MKPDIINYQKNVADMCKKKIEHCILFAMNEQKDAKYN